MEEFQLFFSQGLFHVLDWKAYDHVLFLIVLTIFYGIRDWKRIIGLVTFFTIGHTVTLALSAYQLLHVRMDVVEFLIPLTILITAVYNVLFVNKTSEFLFVTLLFSFIFGLIHGLGFSSYFSMLVYDLENKFYPLIEFALGIEIAQVIITMIIIGMNFLVLTVLNRNKRDWIIIVSSIVIGIVIPMLIERKFW